MERNRQRQELFGVACLTAGLGIIFHLLLPQYEYRHILIVSLVLIVVGVAGVKVMPQLRKRMKLSQSMSITSWPSSTRQNYGAARASLQTQGVSMNELNRYFAWIEKKLHELVVREGLECGLVRMKRGPLVITLQLRLLNPTQKDLQKLMKLGPALAQLLQVETVRIADSAQGILVEVPSPRPLTPNGALLARHTRGLSVAVGVNAAAKPIWVNLEDHGALFWVGPSRRGKTQSIKSVLYALVRENLGQVQFIIIANPAKARKDWGVFAGLQGCLGIAATKEDIAAAAEWLVTHMSTNTDFVQEIHTILVVDDLPAILKAVPQITASLADIAGMGAGLGVHLLVGTQGAGSKSTSGGTEIENNVTARILYRPATSRSGSQSAGTGGLALHQLSSAKGDALALIDGNTTRIATAWISDRDIALLPSGSATCPWHKPTNQQKPENQPEPPSSSGRTRLNHLEPRQNQWEPGETTQNHAEPPATWSAKGFHSNGAVANDRTTTEPVSEPVLEPPAEPVKRLQGYLVQLATLTNEQLRSENLGFDGSRAPTQHEQQIIMQAFDVSASLNKTCLLCYGYKNPKVMGYVKAVVEEPQLTDEPDSAIPDTIDLNTEAGRRLLKQLQGMGAINWPDVRTLMEEDR